MKPAPFDYLRVGSLDEALAALAEHGSEARIIAGGQSLLPMLNMRLAKPALLIDIMGVAGLGEVRREGAMIVVPAGVRQAALLQRPGLASEQPLLAAALPWLGHYQTRARGTVCGSAAHADPSAEIPLCLVALDGEVRLRSRRKRRVLKAADFFSGMMVTDKADDELIEAVAFPAARPGTGYAFNEVARRHGDFAIVGCAAMVEAGQIHLAVAGVADKSERRSWPRLDGSALDDALNAFAWELDAREDLHASARLRRDLVRTLGRSTIEEAGRCLA
ncbi:FAD binding domain-containing protein [Bosea sp. (in: a-proteobacteria)]|jgi:2-furoyl-CoA dehydrogenase FAD binding subunit|uniref:FAD binding domain-containing protein n=1 Tax=Bosea sp. (in: a-proteobacteria) TaxID=1871050 RepID=UPI002DDD2146|nr:FAD binding domain-containing protein [Bosea sp. (in: a-proteobacteria)]HEV2510498.1 FAD binding domain-containing protein [Bosea sp. (in: a-proteobacteria)]